MLKYIKKQWKESLALYFVILIATIAKVATGILTVYAFDALVQMDYWEIDILFYSMKQPAILMKNGAWNWGNTADKPESDRYYDHASSPFISRRASWRYY